MDHFARLQRQVNRYLLLMLILVSVVLIGSAWVGAAVLHLDTIYLYTALGVLALALSLLLARSATSFATEPVRFLWQAILHVSNEHSSTSAPNLQKSKVGRELITSLCLQVYQLASMTGGQNPESLDIDDRRARMVVGSMPLPLFLVDKNQVILFANEAAYTYLGMTGGELTGKNMYSVLDLSFSSTETLDSWLESARANAATASHSWERVRLNQAEQALPARQFDMAAYYSKDNPNGVELILTLFDRTKSYQLDDDAIGFVALSVHELRTPLTLLRGYIEVFEDEFATTFNAEQKDFMRKMHASAEQLSGFVNNILNVARVEADQLILQLHEEKWEDIITDAVQDMNLRAQVHGKRISYSVTPNLPTVAADRVSIYEVLSNLIDNAIKYSSYSQEITVKTVLSKDGFIETTVQDYGVGIPEPVLPTLFQKFQRNYHTQNKIGGTGLGLYLSKAIVSAHGGNIWVRSKEGQGAVFGFTLKPYSMLAEELKNSDNKDIVRGAYGWIKNHSMYRK